MINDRKKYLMATWNWDFLKPCFASHPNIKLSDIDGVVERNGYVLFIEAKGPTAPLPRGQEILLTCLSKKPKVTACVLWGNPELPRFIWIIGKRTRHPCTKDQFISLVSRWFAMADAHGIGDTWIDEPKIQP